MDTGAKWGHIGDGDPCSSTLAPCNGTISALYVQGKRDGLANVTVHRSAGGATISHAATVITCAISSGIKVCSDLAQYCHGDSRRSAADPHHHKKLEPSGGSASPFGMLIEPLMPTIEQGQTTDATPSRCIL